MVFLAGPIQGAQLWQAAAGVVLDRAGLIVASPRRSDTPPDFEEQVAWETRWLNRAAWYGRILFYLDAEHEHDCTRAYAQTTRFELGEWIAKKSSCVVIGAHPSFPGLKYIKSRLAKDYPWVPYFESLDETCKNVIDQFAHHQILG